MPLMPTKSAVPSTVMVTAIAQDGSSVEVKCPRGLFESPATDIAVLDGERYVGFNHGLDETTLVVTETSSGERVYRLFEMEFPRGEAFPGVFCEALLAIVPRKRLDRSGDWASIR